jgi:hypothetical protein
LLLLWLLLINVVTSSSLTNVNNGNEGTTGFGGAQLSLSSNLNLAGQQQPLQNTNNLQMISFGNTGSGANNTSNTTTSNSSLVPSTGLSISVPNNNNPNIQSSAGDLVTTSVLPHKNSFNFGGTGSGSTNSTGSNKKKSSKSSSLRL